MSQRHYIIPDAQIRPGDATDHLDWIAKDVIKRKPGVIVIMGDWWDCPSLSTHNAPGSKTKEGARYLRDLEAGLTALDRLMAPINAAIAESNPAYWNPKKIYIEGNHEYRLARFIENNPGLEGVLDLSDFAVEKYGFKRFPFLTPVCVDGVWYAHYWQNPNSSYPIGGSMDNRLNKIGRTFVQGHQQGFMYLGRSLPTGETIHGLVAGSCYLGAEDYRGAQGKNEWRGVVVLHDVLQGDYDIMPLSLRYLCREATGQPLDVYLRKRYPKRDWSHLARCPNEIITHVEDRAHQQTKRTTAGRTAAGKSKCHSPASRRPRKSAARRADGRRTGGKGR